MITQQSVRGNNSVQIGNNNIGDHNTIVVNNGVPIKHYLELCEAYKRQVDRVLDVQELNLYLMKQNTALKNEIMRLKGLIEK